MTRKSITLFDPNDTRGVSPVIGVILMVAITVILAAVIGTFVLGLGENVSSTTPQAQLSMSVSSGNNITIDHNGGDAIAADSVDIKVVNSSGGSFTVSPTNPDELSVGDSAIINTSDVNNKVAISWPSTVGPAPIDGTAGDSFNLTAGNTYTVKLIDTESQQLIASQKVRP